jgi:AcrR family transcriptional regulator
VRTPTCTLDHVNQVRTETPHRTRLLAAGDELMVELGNFDFGVRDVVERAQVSLRTFYQYFETRDDFTLAIYADLIQEDAVAITRTMPKGAKSNRFRHFVRAMVCPAVWMELIEEYSDDALQRSRALVREGFHLREARPDGYKAAIAPLRELLAGILGADGPDLGRNVAVVFNSLVSEAYDVIIDEKSDADAIADHLYRYHRRALGL